MILKLYKSNVSIGVLLIPLFAVIISLPILVNSQGVVNYSYEWSIFFFSLINQFSVLNFILCVSILVVNAMLINKVFSKTNLFSKTTYVPALFYIVLVTFLDVVSFSPSLVLHLLLIALVSQLMKINKEVSALHISFKSALLIGLMACFSIYYVLLSFIILIALYSIKSFNWREWFLVLFGVSIPLLYLFSTQFVFTNEIDLGVFRGRFDLVTQFNLLNYIQMTCIVLISIISIPPLIKFYSHNTTISRKRVFVLVALFVLVMGLSFVGYYLFAIIDYALILPLTLILATSAISNQRDGLVSLLLTITLVVNIVDLFVG